MRTSGRAATGEIAANKPYSFNADEISRMPGSPPDKRLNFPLSRNAFRRGTALIGPKNGIQVKESRL